MRASLLVLTLAAMMLAGCAQPEDRPAQTRASSVEIPVPHPPPPAAPTGVTKPAHDPEAGNVTLDGASSFATGVLVREIAGRAFRYPCGGAVWAVPEGDADPRGASWRPVGNATLLDDAGRSWLTREYAAEGKRLWVALVGGGEAFTPDDGAASCPPGGAHNVLLHAEGPERLNLWYDPARAPP